MTQQYTNYPRIASVEPMAEKQLRVTFRNGIVKTYDCKPLLTSPAFTPLQNDSLFKQAHADPHGYAVIWNDDIDLAESELWIHGNLV